MTFRLTGAEFHFLSAAVKVKYRNSAHPRGTQAHLVQGLRAVGFRATGWIKGHFAKENGDHRLLSVVSRTSRADVLNDTIVRQCQPVTLPITLYILEIRPPVAAIGCEPEIF
jgi:hypothetical protein